MQALAYGLGLQWKMDFRSKSLLITYYLIPLVFFLFMGGIFTSVMPEMKESLTPAMIVMGVSMGAFLGFPAQIAETYRTDIKKVFQAGGIPLAFPLLAMGFSALLLLFLMSLIILFTAPLIFGAEMPEKLPAFMTALLLFSLASLSLGSVIGLAIPQSGRLTMAAQLLFLPSIMLSGIMFPAEVLPEILQQAGKIFPARSGFRLMQNGGLRAENLLPLLCVLLIAVPLSAGLLRKVRKV